jgi:hypothetical protein
MLEHVRRAKGAEEGTKQPVTIFPLGEGYGSLQVRKIMAISSMRNPDENL